jgi:hypothetical protein
VVVRLPLSQVLPLPVALPIRLLPLPLPLPLSLSLPLLCRHVGGAGDMRVLYQLLLLRLPHLPLLPPPLVTALLLLLLLLLLPSPCQLPPQQPVVDGGEGGAVVAVVVVAVDVALVHNLWPWLPPMLLQLPLPFCPVASQIVLFLLEWMTTPVPRRPPAAQRRAARVADVAAVVPQVHVPRQEVVEKTRSRRAP